MSILISKRVQARMERCTSFSARIDKLIARHLKERAQESIHKDVAIITDRARTRTAVIEFSEFS